MNAPEREVVSKHGHYSLIGGMETDYNNVFFFSLSLSSFCGTKKDVNDNRPVFQPFANTLMLRENAPPAVILTVEATDRDQGVYGQVNHPIPIP